MYYIYHIPGVKIGCTNDVKKRIRQQNFSDHNILEVHTCIHEASRREIELQKEYGYRVDTILYSQIVERGAHGKDNLSKEARIKAGRMMGGRNKKLTLEQAKEIRVKYSTGNYSQRDLAAEYNVGRTRIVDILKHNTYKEA